MAASLRGQTAPCCSPTAPRRALAFSRRSCGSAAGQARTSRFHFRATSEQQQEQQQGSQQAPPPPRRPRQQEGAVSELFTPQAILNYDGHIERAKEFMEQAEASLKDVDSQISEMRQDMEVPAWAVGFLRWARGFHCQTLEEARKRHASLVAKRERYVAGLRQLERELQEQPPMFPPDEGTADWVVLAGYNWAIGQEDDSSEGLQKVLRESLEQANSPNSVLWVTLVVCMGAAYGVAWAGSWWDVDAYRLLHQFPDLAASAPTWVAWTAPYVGGTLLAYSLAPPLFNKSIFRVLATDQQQFFHSVSPPSFLLGAFVIAFSQCLVWQGLWQDVFTGWLGGSRDALLLTDPAALEDGVRASMGTLVGAPLLPAFLVAPSASLLVGLLEGGYFWAMLTAMDATTMMKVDTSDGWRATLVADIKPSVLSQEELTLVAARVALAGSYLALEATLTGSLWLSVGTSMAGLLTVILLSRRGAGP